MLGRPYAKLGILAMMALRLGMAAFDTDSVCVTSCLDHDGIILRTDYGASKHVGTFDVPFS